MKINRILKASALCAVLFAFAGCEDADYQAIENRLYINEAAPDGKFTQQTETLTVMGETSTSVTVRLAQAIDQDVHVSIGIAPEYADAYNASNGTSYTILPEQYLSFEAETVIEAGQIASSPITISISEYSTGNGEAYCIPLKIVSSDAPVATAKTSSHILYLLTKPLLQKVPAMVSSTLPSGSNNWGISTTEWTLEGWIWMSSLPINNQAFWSATVSQGLEIYCRFGDAAVPYDQIQIKTGGSEMQSSMTFSPNTWYHLAITYSNNTLSLYVNGTLDNSKNIEVANYVIENLSLCSSGTWWRCTGQQAQIRFWSKALSQNAIVDAMNRAVSPDSEGLFGYWKLDEGEGSVFHDSTANGFDLTCMNPPTWSTAEVNFSAPNN